MVDKGIIVSFTGFTSNALVTGKSASIDLYSLRPCRKEDVAENIRQVDFVEFIDHKTTAALAFPASDFSYEDAQAIKVSSLINKPVYDAQGQGMGTLEDIGRSMIEFQVLTGGRKSGVLENDLSEYSAYIEVRLKGKRRKITVNSLSVQYKTRIESKSVVFQHSEYYIMKNEITLERRLIPVSHVNYIIRKYGV